MINGEEVELSLKHRLWQWCLWTQPQLRCVDNVFLVVPLNFLLSCSHLRWIFTALFLIMAVCFLDLGCLVSTHCHLWYSTSEWTARCWLISNFRAPVHGRPWNHLFRVCLIYIGDKWSFISNQWFSKWDCEWHFIIFLFIIWNDPQWKTNSNSPAGLCGRVQILQPQD